MKKFVIALVFACIGMTLPAIASAHVFVMDDTMTSGAILHISPDDDPIAGEKSTIYFDTQDKILGEKNTAFSLRVIGVDGKISQVDTKKDGTLVTAQYIFPTQGVYTIAFATTSRGKSYIFEHVQRVSRGASTSALDRPVHTWAEISLISAVVLFSVLCIVGIARRKDIAAQSKQ
jgi:hypothetical protein